MSKSNICLSEPWFGFEQISRDLFDKASSNIWIFDIDYLFRKWRSWRPIRSMIFNHKLISSHSDWSVRTQFATWHHHLPSWWTWPRLTFLQSTIPSQSSSKSQVIHLFFISLIALEHNTILKSTKLSNYTQNRPLHIAMPLTPERSPYSPSYAHFHQILYIHLINNTVDESRQQPVV